MNLPDVDIEDLYNLCAVFAERRSGTRRTWKSLCTDAAAAFTDWGDVNVGDIVVWEVDTIDITTYATQLRGSRLLTPWLRKKRHFGVIEGDGIISDLSYVSTNDGDKVPYIRFRSYNQVREPDYYFKNLDAVKVEHV